ncbi:hypothetical protein ES707_16789 [subsurface metagenome]
MPDGGKTFERPAGNTLSGRIGRYKLRICLLQCLQPGKEFIILPVADFGLIKHVIKVIVPSNLFTKLLNSLFYIFGHNS